MPGNLLIPKPDVGFTVADILIYLIIKLDK